MNNQAIVKTFIVGNFLFGDENDLRDDESLIDQGIIDSTGVLELAVFIEEKFGIKIEDDEMNPENLESIAKICSYVERKGGYSFPQTPDVQSQAGRFNPKQLQNLANP